MHSCFCNAINTCTYQASGLAESVRVHGFVCVWWGREVAGRVMFGITNMLATGWVPAHENAEGAIKKFVVIRSHRRKDFLFQRRLGAEHVLVGFQVLAKRASLSLNSTTTSRQNWKLF